MPLPRSSLRAGATGIAPDSGLTLVEAMITLAIASILLGLALPSMRAFVIQNRLAADTSQTSVALCGRSVLPLTCPADTSSSHRADAVL